MDKMIESKDIPEGEKVYLKKDWFGWRVVNPAKNEDGSWNWLNLFGGREGLVQMVVIIILAIAFYFGVKELISSYATIAANPCNFCSDCSQINRASSAFFPIK